MSKKRIEKNLNELFDDIKKAEDAVDAPIEKPSTMGAETAVEPAQSAPPEGPAPEAPQPPPRGFLARLFSRRQVTPAAGQEVSLDDQKVGRRLVGEVQSEAARQAIPRPKRRIFRRQKPQPEPQGPGEAAPSAAQAAPGQVLEPDLAQVRPTALEEYEPPAAQKEKLRGFRRFKEWYGLLLREQKVLLFSSVFVFFAILFFVLIVLFQPEPKVITPPVSRLNPSIPVPVSVTLPDSQVFELTMGGISEGVWTPQGPEWLVDTEVPRWLALPWSNELDTATVSYTVNDPIQLEMSNGDILVYRYQAKEEIATEEMGGFHANTADLLILLFRPRGSTSLILVATP